MVQLPSSTSCIELYVFLHVALQISRGVLNRNALARNAGIHLSVEFKCSRCWKDDTII